VVERCFMAGCLVFLVLGLEWAKAEVHPMHASGFPRPRCSRVAQPTPRPPAPAEAAARRHRSRSPRFKARRTLHCCAEARCAEGTVPKGRRRKPGPLSVRATLVAHSPCHRSSRFTGRCSSPSVSSCIRQSPPSCPLARRCQARWRAPFPRAASTSQASFRSPGAHVAHSPRRDRSRRL